MWACSLVIFRFHLVIDHTRWPISTPMEMFWPLGFQTRLLLASSNAIHGLTVALLLCGQRGSRGGFSPHSRMCCFLRAGNGTMSRRRVSVKELGQPDHQGWLYRKKESKGFLGIKWKKYWFVLKKTALYWYANQLVSATPFQPFMWDCCLTVVPPTFSLKLSVAPKFRFALYYKKMYIVT